ncbi:hypothetical protein SAMN05421821_11484 [Mucilaginibacter lappiensis]|nr:hypothetical protein SAMN05421821_11484 [Mucilaginibacter lappiensis]
MRVNEALRQLKWNIIEIWGCKLKKNTIQNTFSKLPDLIKSVLHQSD